MKKIKISRPTIVILLKFAILMTLFYLVLTASPEHQYEFIKMFFGAAATFAVDLGQNHVKRHSVKKEKLPENKT